MSNAIELASCARATFTPHQLNDPRIETGYNINLWKYVQSVRDGLTADGRSRLKLRLVRVRSLFDIEKRFSEDHCRLVLEEWRSPSAIALGHVSDKDLCCADR